MGEEIDRERSTLRAFFDTLPAMAWMKDLEGRYLACNPVFESLYGAPEAAIVGKTDYDFVAPELASFFRQKDEEARLANKSSVNEGWVTFASDGHHALLETVKAPVHNSHGESLGIIGIARDISERKRKEDELQDNLRFTRELIEAIPNPVFFKDADGVYLGCNAAFERYYGIRREELIGKGVFGVWPQELAERYHEADQQLIKNLGSQCYETQVQTPEGVRNVVFHKATFSRADGSIGGLIGVIHDITEYKCMENALNTKTQECAKLQQSMEHKASRDV